MPADGAKGLCNDVGPSGVRCSIFHKECKPFGACGLSPHPNRTLGAAQSIRRVNLKPLPLWKSRWDRMTQGQFVVYQKAREENAGVYHFHYAELIPAALLLWRAGKRVIYDTLKTCLERFPSSPMFRSSQKISFHTLSRELRAGREPLFRP